MKAILIFAIFSLAAHAQTAERDARLAKIDFVQRLGSSVPLELPVRTEDGTPSILKNIINGHPTILVLAYSACPNLCGLVFEGLIQALRDIPLRSGKDFETVVLSLDPNESPGAARGKRDQLLKRLDGPHPRATLHFLTAPQDTISQVAEAIGFHYAYDPETREYLHPSGLVVLSSAGLISRYFFGIRFPPQSLRTSLEEAGKNHVGSVAQRLLLYCFHYDPKTGRYGIVIMNTLKILGLITLLALGCLFWQLKKKKI